MDTPGGKKLQKDFPEIFEAYDIYALCRNQTPYHHEYVKGGKSYARILPFTTGLSFLPFPGSVMDQPERLITYFDAFLSGDAEGFAKSVNNK